MILATTIFNGPGWSKGGKFKKPNDFGGWSKWSKWSTLIYLSGSNNVKGKGKGGYVFTFTYVVYVRF